MTILGNEMDEFSNEILKIVTNFYLDSGDFNGIQIWKLLDSVEKDWNEFSSILKTLIEEEKIRIIDEKTDVNPNIIRLGFESKEVQLEKTDQEDPSYICLYPSSSHLEKAVEKEEFEREPYKLLLALGEPHLSYRTFDLSVLEFYRNDPRYYYENDDIRGQIFYEDDEMPDRDKSFLQTFGFSYDEELNRAVSVYLRYLSDLTPEHQQIWKSKEHQGDYKLHPDYYRNTILGDWGEKEPVCQAFIQELHIINKMANAMGRQSLFREDFGKYGENRPKRFHFLIRPTLKEFNSFILLFDKMVSENINKKFFQNDISYEREEERSDGKVIIRYKGTINLLDEWVRKKFRPLDWSPWEEAIDSFKKLRKLRQKPAHAINEDVFDQKYFKKQREIIIEVYEGIRTLRLILANHPKVKNAEIDIPDWLYKGKIWHI